MKLLIAALLLMFSSLLQPVQAAESRFNAVVFLQPEQMLIEKKKVNFEDVARFSRKMQSNIWNVLKKADVPNTSGFLVVAVRSDGAIAAWLDMEPAMDAFYSGKIVEAVQKVQPFDVATGTVVFGIKFFVDTPKWFVDKTKHTTRSKPTPKEWKAARAKLANPDDIDELMMAVWPQ